MYLTVLLMPTLTAFQGLNNKVRVGTSFHIKINVVLMAMSHNWHVYTCTCVLLFRKDALH